MTVSLRLRQTTLTMTLPKRVKPRPACVRVSVRPVPVLVASVASTA